MVNPTNIQGLLKMSFIDNFNYQILGTSGHHPPIVFLHGLMGYAQNWKRIATELKEFRQILIFDQRGHGKSFHPPHGYRPEDYADDLLKIIDEIKLEKIDIVGHSMGGRNALNFAFRFSNRVNKFVIEDIGPEVVDGSMERIQHLISLVPVPFATKLDAKNFFLNEYPQLIGKNKQSQTLAQYFYSNIIEDEQGRAVWRFSLDAIFESLIEGRAQARWHEWQSIQLPILIIRGEQSQDLSLEIFQRMIQSNPNSRGVEVKGSGHWVHFEKPEIFINLVKDFVIGQSESSTSDSN